MQKISMEYFQFFSKGKQANLWPTWFTDALLEGKASLRAEGGVILFNLDRELEDVVVEEGDYIALTLGGNLCKLEFMEEIKD